MFLEMNAAGTERMIGKKLYFPNRGFPEAITVFPAVKIQKTAVTRATGIHLSIIVLKSVPGKLSTSQKEKKVKARPNRISEDTR